MNGRLFARIVALIPGVGEVVRRRRRGVGVGGDDVGTGARMIVWRALPGTRVASVLVGAAESSLTNGLRTTFSV